MKRSLSGIMVILLLTSMLALAFNIQSAGASGTIYIRADGSVEGTDKIFTMNNITYTFTDNIYDSIVVERDNILLDGQGYLLQGTGSGNGITLDGRSNVTLRNIEINAFFTGVFLISSSDNTVSGNNITANNGDGVHLRSSSNNTVSGNNIIANSLAGVLLWDSSNYNTVSGNNITSNNGPGVHLWAFSNCNTVSGNTITNNGYGVSLGSSSNYNTVSGNNITANYYHGVSLGSSSNNTVYGNNITNNDDGVYLGASSGNTVSGNNITNNDDGVYLGASSGNTVSGNNITNNDVGVYLVSSSGNRFYHNSFISNTDQVYSIGSVNIWDNGYPSGGNYWSNYTDVDSYKGRDQNETGGDGVWDQPYIVDEDNQDRYPLTKPYGGPTGDVDGDHDVDIFDIVRMAGVYGVTYPDQRYDRQCDMDLDGDIDIYDIVAAAGHYGESW